MLLECVANPGPSEKAEDKIWQNENSWVKKRFGAFSSPDALHRFHSRALVGSHNSTEEAGNAPLRTT